MALGRGRDCRRRSCEKGKAMSATHTNIGEYDVVTLVNAVGGWPAGTKGTVVDAHPPYKTVEIEGIEQSDDDMLDYLPMVADEDLRLVRKWSPPTS
jgi:hypothetical protein